MGRDELREDAYNHAVLATGWHNGQSPTDPGGYGIKFTAADRDHYFDPDWDEVEFALDTETVIVPLSPSFWRSCSEVRSAAIGRWLLEQGSAPWSSGTPPGIAVEKLDGNRFTARVLRRRQLR